MDQLQLLLWWYDWGVLAGLIVTLAVAFWIFYDSRQKPHEAMAWRLLSGVGVLLVLPSLYAKYTTVSNLINALQTGDILTAFAGLINAYTNLPILTYLGILGVVAGIVAVVGYLAYGRHSSAVPPTIRAPIPPTTPVTSPPLPASAQTVPAPQPFIAEPVLQKTRIQGTQLPALAWVAVERGSHQGARQDMRQDRPLAVGRDGQQCELVLDDPEISSQHALIKYEQGRFVVYDMASTNGTFVNGHRVQRQSLMDGDRIRIGGTTLIFKEAGQAGGRR